MNPPKLNIAIVDDEKRAVLLLKELIQKTRFAGQIHEFTSPLKAKLNIPLLSLDLIFLDVMMGSENGIDMLDDLRDLGVTTDVVFVTAFDEFAIEALKRRAIDYFLKPIDMCGLQKCLFSTAQKKEQSYKGRSGQIRFNNLNGCIFLLPEEIGYIKADVNYSHIHFMDGRKEIVSQSLGKVVGQLPPDLFIRVDRSHLVNNQYLYKVDLKRRSCTLRSSGKELVFSPSLEGLKKLRR